MINFIEGQINLGTKNFRVDYNLEELNTLAEEGLIEKCESGSGSTYYFVEAMLEGIRFGVFITLRAKKIDWVRLSWLDSPIKGWEDVSEKAVRDEFHLLLNLVENTLKVPPNNKKNRQRTWCFKWGQLNVSYDLRAFQADIYMKPL